MRSRDFTLICRGPLACFTRVEFRTDRLSYEAPTHAALVGMLDQFLSNSKMMWSVHECHILKPIRWMNFLRNELLFTQLNNEVEIGNTIKPTQRNTTCLHDVEYRFTAHFELTAKGQDKYSDNIYGAVQKYETMFLSHMASGHFVGSLPYFGFREFEADVFLDNGEHGTFGDAIDLDYDVGLMHHSVVKTSKKYKNYFFDANIRNGIIKYPSRADVLNKNIAIG
jgi:CRISPR-associated protein Cas5d